MKKLRSALAVLLMMCMLIGILPAPSLAVAEESSMQTTLSATEIPGLSRLEGTDASAEEEDYAPETMVDVIIIMEEDAVLDDFQAADTGDLTAGEAVSEFLASEEAAGRTEALLEAQNEVIRQIMDAEVISETPRVLSQWTGIANGMAVRVPLSLIHI